MTDLEFARRLAATVTRGIAAGRAVELEPLGVFYPDPHTGFRFEPYARTRVFIAYAKEDSLEAALLYDDLAASGFTPWMDVRRLLPGQNWPRAIETAIETSDFFIPCFSENSVNKRGGFQAELRYALDCARRVPLDEIFIVPVRLNACRMPHSIVREYQYVDLFPEWRRGLRRVLSIMRRGRGGSLSPAPLA